jgi:CubicO group peptidase (beta-lactamase class C family)
VVSCLDDLLIWARMLLALGLHDGKQVVDSASLEEMWSPHIAIPIGGPYAQAMPFSKQPGYGLGFMVHEYAGREIVEHGGQTDGMHAEMFLVPEEELGVVVLTNGLNLFLPHAIAYRIVDEIFERPIQPAQTAFWKSWQQMAPGMTALKFQAPSRITPPTQELRARWQGSYRSGLYGEASLSGAGEHLTLTALGRTATLHAMGGGRFAVDWGRDLFMNISATTLQIRTAAEPAGDRLVLRSVAFSRAP